MVKTAKTTDKPTDILRKNESNTSTTEKSAGKNDNPSYFQRKSICCNKGLLENWKQPINQGNSRTIRLTHSNKANKFSVESMNEYLAFLKDK